MDFSVVVCTYNRPASLRETLESFTRLAVPPNLSLELLVVDNNSSDDTARVVQKFAEFSGLSIRYLFEPRQGKSHALNAGVREARGEVVAFTDDDVLFDPQWLINLEDLFKEYECIGVGGRVVPVWNHPKPSWLEMDGRQTVVHFDKGEAIRLFGADEGPPIGANMAFRREAFEKYGLFRTDLGPGTGKQRITCEDEEFGFRVMKAGEKILYAPAAIVYHPVDTQRLTQSYALRWSFNLGRSVVRLNLWRGKVASYHGIPRWLVRSLIANSLKWLISVDRDRRFCHRRLAYEAAGGIFEALRLGKDYAPETPRL